MNTIENDQEDLNPLASFEDESTTRVSMETHIPETNVGYKLLQKMGWVAGKGLGSQGQGRIDPIRIELKDDCLGVGKAEEYTSAHVSTTSKRKAMDFEKQLEETDEQRVEREMKVEKRQAIAKELEEVKRVFYCELCDKQYKKISEFEQHLQSYDHHHKKRFKDMKESTRNSAHNQSEREKKLAREKKREERELKRMQEAMHKKAGINVSNAPSINTSVATSNNRSLGGGWSTVSDTGKPAGEGGSTASKKVESTSGGWSTVSDKVESTSGGWSTVADTSKPAGEGVSTVSDKAKNTSGGWSTVTESSTTTPSVSKDKAPILEDKSVSKEQPKKLAFGLKKSSGFQFGLKKK